MKPATTIDPFSRLGTTYALMFVEFTERDESGRRALINTLDNVAASVGQALPGREAVTLPADELGDEFCRVLDLAADAPAGMQPIVVNDFEEFLAIHRPGDCLKHINAHRLWSKDHVQYARLMSLILERLAKNDAACRQVTELVHRFSGQL